MIKIQIKLALPKFNVSNFTKALTEALETQSRQAARAWLRAVLTKVPVYTGEARGSLKPLGQFLRVAIPISPSTSRQAQYHIARGQNESTGEAKGDFEFKTENNQIIFIFSTDVAHFLVNEFYDVSDKIHLIEEVPWFALRAGKKAYEDYLSENLKQKIPKVKDFITSEITNIGSI